MTCARSELFPGGQPRGFSNHYGNSPGVVPLVPRGRHPLVSRTVSGDEPHSIRLEQQVRVNSWSQELPFLVLVMRPTSPYSSQHDSAMNPEKTRKMSQTSPAPLLTLGTSGGSWGLRRSVRTRMITSQDLSSESPRSEPINGWHHLNVIINSLPRSSAMPRLAGPSPP